jgi:hypothetical protein
VTSNPRVGGSNPPRRTSLSMPKRRYQARGNLALAAGQYEVPVAVSIAFYVGVGLIGVIIALESEEVSRSSGVLLGLPLLLSRGGHGNAAPPEEIGKQAQDHRGSKHHEQGVGGRSQLWLIENHGG